MRQKILSRAIDGVLFKQPNYFNRNINYLLSKKYRDDVDF